MKIENSIDIDQPPSVVYEFLMDEENLPLWLTNFVRLERISENQGEVGTLSKHIYNENGRIVELIEEIKNLQPNTLTEAEYSHPNFTMYITNRLTPVAENATRLTVSSSIRLHSFIMRLSSFFVRKAIDKRNKQDLVNLKNAIEELTEIE